MSWGLPFGKAIADIAPGAYVCNAKILQALQERHVEFEIPAQANFADHLEPHKLDEQTFVAGQQVAPTDMPTHFYGFPRTGKRGTGTRNFVVVLGTTSRTGPCEAWRHLRGSKSNSTTLMASSQWRTLAAETRPLIID